MGPDEFAERVFSHFSEYIENSELCDYVDAVSLVGTYPDAATIILFRAPSKPGEQFGERCALFRDEDGVLMWTGPAAPAGHLPYDKPDLFAWEMWFGLWEDICSGSFTSSPAGDDGVSWTDDSD